MAKASRKIMVGSAILFESIESFFTNDLITRIKKNKTQSTGPIAFSLNALLISPRNIAIQEWVIPQKAHCKPVHHFSGQRYGDPLSAFSSSDGVQRRTRIETPIQTTINPRAILGELDFQNAGVMLFFMIPAQTSTRFQCRSFINQ